jgi:hypothetical protein
VGAKNKLQRSKRLRGVAREGETLKVFAAISAARSQEKIQNKRENKTKRIYEKSIKLTFVPISFFRSPSSLDFGEEGTEKMLEITIHDYCWLMVLEFHFFYCFLFFGFVFN